MNARILTARAVLAAVLTTATALASLPARAQTPAPAEAAPEMADAEVRRIDLENGRITLRHGPIKNLDMPPMTMVFEVKDRAVLGGLKPGDKVRFRADKEGSRYTVTALEAVR